MSDSGVVGILRIRERVSEAFLGKASSAETDTVLRKKVVLDSKSVGEDGEGKGEWSGIKGKVEKRDRAV